MMIDKMPECIRVKVDPYTDLGKRSIMIVEVMVIKNHPSLNPS